MACFDCKFKLKHNKQTRRFGVVVKALLTKRKFIQAFKAALANLAQTLVNCFVRYTKIWLYQRS